MRKFFEVKEVKLDEDMRPTFYCQNIMVKETGEIFLAIGAKKGTEAPSGELFPVISETTGYICGFVTAE